MRTDKTKTEQTEAKRQAAPPVAVAKSPEPVTGMVKIGNWPPTKPVAVNNFPELQAVAIASLPLPDGAATADRQDTSAALLEQLYGKVSGPRHVVIDDDTSQTHELLFRILLVLEDMRAAILKQSV